MLRDHEVIAATKYWTNLVELSISNNQDLSDATLMAISESCHDLRCLIASYNWFTDQSLCALESLSKLVYLDWGSQQRITTHTLVELANLRFPALRVLDLTNSGRHHDGFVIDLRAPDLDEQVTMAYYQLIPERYPKLHLKGVVVQS